MGQAAEFTDALIHILSAKQLSALPVPFPFPDFC